MLNVNDFITELEKKQKDKMYLKPQKLTNKEILHNDIINIINGQHFYKPIKMETSAEYVNYLGKYVHLCNTKGKAEYIMTIKKELAVTISELLKITNYIENEELGLLQAFVVKKIFQIK
ncbi:MAG: hypothetical protein U9P90_02145 [Patescibacteria group bacterium]|nr:hypothetical protein [Patescibacteria group bacterium]